MINIVIYDSLTGDVTRSMSVTKESDVAIQCGAEEGWIYGKINDRPYKFRVIDGILLKKSDEEIREQETPEAWEALRRKRNIMLKSSDWTQVPDAPVDQSAWAIYRQALRDLPANTTDPFNPPWPTKPQ